MVCKLAILSSVFVLLEWGFFFFLFTDVPVTYGSSQARGLMGAAAEAYATVTATPDPATSMTYAAACGDARS